MAIDFDRLKASLADRYAVEREIGQGGMAVVYLAGDLKHSRNVAIKVLRPELAATLGTERFLREIETAAKLNHPHILGLIDSGEADGFLYYVMPYVDGESLRQRLERDGQLPIEDALLIAREVADGLGYAHRHGLVHRDIKPGNILLSEDHAVIADFGIAKAIAEAGGAKVTETGLALGSPTYMSPEQGSGDRAVDSRADQYSLACVVYEMLTGQPPFSGNSAQAVFARHAADAVPPIRSVRPAVGESVETAITKALAKLPADRFSTVEEFSRALGSGVVDGPGRRTSRWAILAVVALVLAVGSVFMVLQDDGTARSAPGIEALRLYNEGQLSLSKVTESDVRHAIVLFRQALDRDSTFVEAWVGLANAYCLRAIATEAMDPREAMPNCKDAAERALAIDESIAAAHVALAAFHEDYAWDRPAARKELNRALALDPNSTGAYMRLAPHHSYAERYDEAFEASERLIQLAPADPLSWTLAGVQYYWAEQYEEALTSVDRAFEIDPNFPAAVWLEGAIDAERGRYDAAIENLHRVAELSGYTVWRAWPGYVYALAGDTRNTEETLAELMAEISEGSPLSSNLSVAVAMIHIGTGDRDEAFRWLNRSADLRSTILPFVLTSPVGRRLGEDPRYQELRQRVQLPPSTSILEETAPG